MKRLLIILAVILPLVSCSKMEKERKKDTTYSFVVQGGLFNKLNEIASDNGYMLVTMDVIFSEYYDGHRIYTHKINEVFEGTIYQFNPQTNAEYVTVRYDIKLSNNQWAKDKKMSSYIANVFYLKEGQNVAIYLDENTLVSDIEPK